MVKKFFRCLRVVLSCCKFGVKLLFRPWVECYFRDSLIYLTAVFMALYSSLMLRKLLLEFFLNFTPAIDLLIDFGFFEKMNICISSPKKFVLR